MRNLQKGYILISVCVVMSVLLIMTYFFADSLFSELSIARNEQSATIAFHLAESGIQEAVWRVENDSTTRNTFLDTTNGVTNFNHANGLLNGGSYNVSIQNTAKGAAEITSTAYYQIGTKQAQRKITLKVNQSNTTYTYPYDAGLLVGGATPGNIDLHNMTLALNSSPDPNNMITTGNVSIGNASATVSQNIIANGAVSTNNSVVTTGGTTQQYSTNIYTIPGVDLTSSDPGSYKSLATAQNQYYTSSQFATLIKNQTSFNGVVYVAGTGGVTIKNKNITINGALVSEGTININNANLTINHTSGPSGLITLQNLNFNNAAINIAGLVYAGVQGAASNNVVLNVTGAVLANSFSGNNCAVTINFNKSLVNEALAGGGTNNTTGTIIEMKHWEEEY